MWWHDLHKYNHRYVQQENVRNIKSNKNNRNEATKKRIQINNIGYNNNNNSNKFEIFYR
jgi:hypothetical protein